MEDTMHVLWHRLVPVRKPDPTHDYEYKHLVLRNAQLDGTQILDTPTSWLQFTRDF
jgi:hypothetical protein